MRLSEPRIPPLAVEEFVELEKRLFGRPPLRERPLNVMLTTAQNPALAKARAPLLQHLVPDSTLPPRERELVILRVGWLCDAEYEFGHHWEMGRDAGLTDEEVERVTDGPDAAGWTPFESTLLQAVDELVGDRFITDETWAKLNERYARNQVMDLVHLVGSYVTTSMALNSFGVQLEPGTPGFPQQRRPEEGS